jgi:outer membrane protein assembly factor BamE (lipoprotein component of BamABCDE complex)
MDLSTIPIEENAVRKSKAIGLIAMLAVLTPAAAMLAGCAGSYGSVIEPEKVAAIIRGKTTKADVLTALGDPDKTTDLGGGKEEFSYVRENVANHGNWFHSDNKALWILFKNNTVEAFGERATIESPKRIGWPF